MASTQDELRAQHKRAKERSYEEGRRTAIAHIILAFFGRDAIHEFWTDRSRQVHADGEGLGDAHAAGEWVRHRHDALQNERP